MQEPEDLYKLTADKNERRRLQAAVIARCNAKVSALARSLVPAQHVAEAVQEGRLGLLMALEKYDPSQVAPPETERTDPFWSFAFPYVREQIQQWIDHGVYWRAKSETYNGAVIVAPLASGREFDVEIKTDGDPATRGEIVEALRQAIHAVMSPIEK